MADAPLPLLRGEILDVDPESRSLKRAKNTLVTAHRIGKYQLQKRGDNMDMANFDGDNPVLDKLTPAHRTAIKGAATKHGNADHVLKYMRDEFQEFIKYIDAKIFEQDVCATPHDLPGPLSALFPVYRPDPGGIVDGRVDHGESDAAIAQRVRSMLSMARRYKQPVFVAIGDPANRVQLTANEITAALHPWDTVAKVHTKCRPGSAERVLLDTAVDAAEHSLPEGDAKTCLRALYNLLPEEDDPNIPARNSWNPGEVYTQFNATQGTLVNKLLKRVSCKNTAFKMTDGEMNKLPYGFGLRHDVLKLTNALGKGMEFPFNLKEWMPWGVAALANNIEAFYQTEPLTDSAWNGLQDRLRPGSDFRLEQLDVPGSYAAKAADAVFQQFFPPGLQQIRSFTRVTARRLFEKLSVYDAELKSLWAQERAVIHDARMRARPRPDRDVIDEGDPLNDGLGSNDDDAAGFTGDDDVVMEQEEEEEDWA